MAANAGSWGFSSWLAGIAEGRDALAGEIVEWLFR